MVRQRRRQVRRLRPTKVARLAALTALAAVGWAVRHDTPVRRWLLPPAAPPNGPSPLLAAAVPPSIGSEDLHQAGWDAAVARVAAAAGARADLSTAPRTIPGCNVIFPLRGFPDRPVGGPTVERVVRSVIRSSGWVEASVVADRGGVLVVRPAGAADRIDVRAYDVGRMLPPAGRRCAATVSPDGWPILPDRSGNPPDARSAAAAWAAGYVSGTVPVPVPVPVPAGRGTTFGPAGDRVRRFGDRLIVAADGQTHRTMPDVLAEAADGLRRTAFDAAATAAAVH